MRHRLTTTLALLALSASPAAAQQLPLSASLYHRVEGERVRAAIELRIEPGWHIYHETLGPKDAVGLPTSVTLAAEGVAWEPVVFPEPLREEQPGLVDGGGDTWIWAHEGRVVLSAEGELEGEEPPPAVEAKLKGLVCEAEGTCLPVALDLRSKGAGPDRLFPAEPASEGAPSAGEGPQEQVAQAPAAALEWSSAAGTPEIQGRFWVRREGAWLRGVIRLEMKDGWHLYHDDLGDSPGFSLPTSVDLQGAGVSWGRALFPEPKAFTDALGESALVHEGSIDLRVSGEVTGAGEPSGLGARIRGQVCSNLCLPVDLELAALGPGPDEAFAWTSASSDPLPDSPSGSGAGSAVADDAAPGADEPLRKQGDKGLLGFLLLAVGGGLFALMMPCTYPMIPITISFFTKQADARGGKVLSLALAYGAGIVLIFVLIGVVVGPVIIAFATHPVTNLTIGLLFLVFAAALFGALNLQPPRFLMNAAGQATMHGGFFGVFLMGATLVVSSFTCTAPFVGSLLSFGAVEGGNLGRVALGMGVFGLTMAVPFVLLSLLPGKVQAMPRSGEWMNTLKVTLGFVEIAAAFKFISNSDVSWKWDVFSRELFLLLWAAIFLLCAIYLFGWIKLQGHGTQELSPGRMTAGVGTLLFALYCWHGMKGGELDYFMTAMVPPYSSPGDPQGGERTTGSAGERSGHQIVVDDYERARELAESQGKLLLINFTGHTCVNCRVMEKKVFPSLRVAPLLEGMVEARLHTDGLEDPANTERIKALQRKLTQSIANPIYLVVDPQDGRILGRQDGGSSAESFAEFLIESASRAKVARR